MLSGIFITMIQFTPKPDPNRQAPVLKCNGVADRFSCRCVAHENQQASNSCALDLSESYSLYALILVPQSPSVKPAAPNLRIPSPKTQRRKPYSLNPTPQKPQPKPQKPESYTDKLKTQAKEPQTPLAGPKTKPKFALPGILHPRIPCQTPKP